MTTGSPHPPGRLIDDARSEPLACAVIGLALTAGTA
jgi:hypothetical protein